MTNEGSNIILEEQEHVRDARLASKIGAISTTSAAKGACPEKTVFRKGHSAIMHYLSISEELSNKGEVKREALSLRSDMIVVCGSS
jgi:hypothetical protein